MNASWAGVAVAITMLAVTLAAIVWRAGRRDGIVDTILDRLTDIAGDHENRIRELEHSGLNGHGHTPDGDAAMPGASRSGRTAAGHGGRHGHGRGTAAGN